MAWFGVRCVFELPTRGLFEERLTLWKASSIEDAIERAEHEAGKYARDVDAHYAGLAQAYELYDEPNDGAEVFSLMRESDLDPQAYVSRFFDTGNEREQR